MIMIVVVLRTKPSGLYRHRRGLGLHRVGYREGDLHPNRQACLPRQGESHPDTGRSLQSFIFIVQQSIGVELYAADVLRDGILPIELLNFHLRNIYGAKLHKNNEINFVLRKIIIKTW